MSPRGVAAFFTTFLVGRLVGRIPLRVLLCFGFSMLSLSSYMLSGINLQVSMASVVLPTVLNGVAISFIFVPLTTATMSQLRQQEIGSGTGLYNLMLNLGGSVGIALVTTLVARGAQAHQALMVGHLTPADPVFVRQLMPPRPRWPGIADPVTATDQAYALFYNLLNQQAHLWAFVDTFRVFGLMVLCCIPLIFLFKRVKRPVVRQVEVQ